MQKWLSKSVYEASTAPWTDSVGFDLEIIATNIFNLSNLTQLTFNF